MGRLFGWLDRGYVETIKEYDNRMNQLPELHAGYVFFDWINYRSHAQSFSVFIEWNGELNHKLQDSMPQGGYCFHCTTEEAASLINDHNGIPVYIKLYAKCGRLYVRKLYFNGKNKQYEIHFNGCEVIPPDMVCFVGLQNYSSQQGILSLLESREENIKEEKPKRWWTGSGRAARGSYRNYRGSYRNFRGSFSGSYRGLFGSYRGYGGSYSNLMGSYRGFGGSYYGVYGSYRSLLGSYRNLGVGYGSYWSHGGYQGSFYRNSLGGSYRNSLGSSYRSFLGSYRYLGGSYHGSFRGFNGSYFEGFYQNMINGSESFADDTVEENQIDGALGYGLELI